MGITRTIFSVFLALFLLIGTAHQARADCLNPAGTAGKQIYNSTHNVMQFCDGTNWISMADTGVSSDTLAALSCGDGQVAEWDNGGSAWVCATPSVPTESDPQVGTLTNTKWCTTDGTTIDCTSDAPVLTESDPKIGTLTNTKWCTTDGTAIDCTTDAPASVGAIELYGPVTANTSGITLVASPVTTGIYVVSMRSGGSCGSSSGTNLQVNIGGSWETIGDTYKTSGGSTNSNGLPVLLIMDGTNTFFSGDAGSSGTGFKQWANILSGTWNGQIRKSSSDCSPSAVAARIR